MTILFRYISRQILLFFTIILAAVLSIYVAVDFIEKIDNFMESQVPVERCVIYLLYKIPFIFVQISPLGFLLSILVTFGIMSKNNEVIALKSCGIGVERLLKPAFVLGIFFCAVLFVVAEMVVPVFMVNANQIWLQEVKKKNIFASKTNDIWMRASRQIIHISQYEPEKKGVVDITIYFFDDNFRLTRRVDAESGEYVNGHWRLANAVSQDFNKQDGEHKLVSLASMNVPIELNPDDLAKAAKRSDEMGLDELKRYIQKVEREGYSATRFRVDYHGKMAAPFVCIFLSLLGTGIALRSRLREGMALSIAYGLGLAFLYWIFHSFCISLGYAEMLPAVVAAWTANVVFLCISGLLLLTMN